MDLCNCHSTHTNTLQTTCTTIDGDMYITDCILINGNLTVNGTMYYVRSKQDLHKVESLDTTISFEKINLDNTTLVCINNDVVVNGNLIMCEELGYQLTVKGSTTTMNSATI